MRYGQVVLAAVLIALPARAQTVSFSGSVAAESLYTPAQTNSALNPENVAQIPANTNLADFLTRAQFADVSNRWKGSVRLHAEVADGRSASVHVNELSVSASPNSWLMLSAGRITEKWGSGYAWNPSAFIAPRKNPSDPNDRRGVLGGIDMVKADALIGGNSVAVYALRGGALAARGSRLVGPVDLSMYVHHDETTNAGLSVSTVFREALELHAEVARGKVLLGGQYTFANQWNVVAELYHSDLGMSADAWNSFRDDVSTARDREAFLDVNRRFESLQMQRDYFFLRAAKSWTRTRLTTEVLSITGLRDGSSLVRMSLSWAVRPNFSFYAVDTEFAGSAQSEMSYMQIERSASFGAKLYF